MSWNSNNSRTFNKVGNIMLSGQESIKKNPQFLDLNSEKGMPKTVAKDTVTDVLSSKFSWAGVYSSVTGEEKSNSKQSSSGVESNCLDTALIDLKLGRFPDKKDAQFKDNPSFSSAQSSLPRKRARPGNSNSQTPFCQVEGCNKDLSACKDYNKRHKVCEIHSKTAKVYVNGVEQRFCQQCSRFHSLSEFDDGKRSCRKRLAGHNERRRKNHASLVSTRRLIPPYNGTNFLESSYASSSYVCPNVLHRSHLHPPPQKHEFNNWNRNPSTDHYSTAAAFNNMNSSNKSSPFHDDDVLIPVTRTKENDHFNSSLMTNMSSSDFDSLSLYQQNSPIEDLNVLDESSSFKGRLQRPSSSSSCALSLLSSAQSQTQQPSYISSNIPTSHYSFVQISGNPTTSADETNMESLLITDSMVGSDKYGFNEFIPCSSGAGGDDSTIDLLELSSQLHNVENERQSMQMKQDDNDAFFGLRIT